MDNPATLARYIAEQLVVDGDLDSFEVSDEEKESLVALDGLAAHYELVDKMYFVESGRSILLPVSFEANQPMEAPIFQELTFRGEFKTYSTVRFMRSIGGQSLRALCLTFDKVTLLPYFDEIRDDELLHVPVLAVWDIDQMAA